MEALEIRPYCPTCNSVFRTPFSRCPLDGTKLAESTDDPLVGTVLDGRYTIEECIGEGGMGRVYSAKHTRMSRQYAIKVLFGDHAADKRMRSRFAREAEGVSRLSHPNVISVVDFGETEESLLYLVMDLAEGISLSELVRKEAPFADTRAVAILAKLAKGLAHAHEHGLVHRDFKCENVIMVREDGIETPKIVDFGICMIVEDAPSNTMLTSSGMIMGTPAVMAPEQASGDTVDHRTDLFSLGIVGYEMLAGCLPFDGTPLEMARKNLYETIPRIQERSGVFINPALEAIITRLTAKKPDERYQNADAVVEDLRSLGLGGNFHEWTNPTPSPKNKNVRSPLSHSENSHTIGYGDTRMVSPLESPSFATTQLNPAISSKQKKFLLLGLGAAAVLLLTLALFVSGDEDSTDNSTGEQQTESVIANNHKEETDIQATQPTVRDDKSANDLIANTKSPGKTEIPKKDIAEENKKKTILPSRTTKRSTAKTKAKPTAKTKSNASKTTRNHDSRTSKGPKVKPNPDKSKTNKEALLKKTFALYRTTASKLSDLERKKGKQVTSKIRARFNKINYSALRQNHSLQPKIYKELKGIQAKIVRLSR